MYQAQKLLRWHSGTEASGNLHYCYPLFQYPSCIQVLPPSIDVATLLLLRNGRPPAAVTSHLSFFESLY